MVFVIHSESTSCIGSTASKPAAHGGALKRAKIREKAKQIDKVIAFCIATAPGFWKSCHGSEAQTDRNDREEHWEEGS